MIPSTRCYDLIKKYEGLFLTAYLCPANVPTIGYGTTMYATGVKVKLGEKISLQMAQELLEWEVNNKGKVVAAMNLKLTQNQFDAIVSFVYNLGIGNFNKSTLLRKIRVNPNDATIVAEFAKWNKGGGKVLKGLVTRRKEESDLYFQA
jgi:lysozyme